MPFITVDKENSKPVNLYYEDHGHGQPVVMIHGFPLSAEAWEKQQIALLEAGFRTIAYDRRGFGRSDKPTFGYDYDTFTADLDHIMTELDLRDVVLMGHSMGTGEVTRYIGTRGSERVARAVLISPLQPFLLKTEDNPEGVDKSLFEGFQEAIRYDRPAYLTAFMSDFYNLDENLGKSVSDEIVREGWNTASMASPAGVYECVSAWQTDFRKDIEKIDVPTLIIQGESDRVLPFAITGARLHKAISGSRLVALKDAPHGIPWTHAAEINQELLAFLKPAEATSKAEERQAAPSAWAEPAFAEKIQRDDD